MSNLSNNTDWKKLYNLVDDLSKRQDCGTLLYHKMIRITTTYVMFFDRRWQHSWGFSAFCITHYSPFCCLIIMSLHMQLIEPFREPVPWKALGKFTYV